MMVMQVVQAEHGGPEGRPVALTAHAHQRCAQRGIAPADVRQVVQHGRLIHNAGARFAFLGRKEIAEACAEGADRRAVEKLQGLVVLLGEDGWVITAYRNARALADIRTKTRYARRTRRRQEVG